MLLIDTHDKLIKIFICTYISKFFFSSNLANPKCKYFRKLVKDVHTDQVYPLYLHNNMFIAFSLLPHSALLRQRVAVHFTEQSLCFNNL